MTVQDIYVQRLGPGSNDSLSDVKKVNKATKTSNSAALSHEMMEQISYKAIKEICEVM